MVWTIIKIAEQWEPREMTPEEHARRKAESKRHTGRVYVSAVAAACAAIHKNAAEASLTPAVRFRRARNILDRIPPVQEWKHENHVLEISRIVDDDASWEAF